MRLKCTSKCCISVPWWLSLTDEMQTRITEELVLVFLLPDARWEFQVLINVQFDLKGNICFEEELL